VLARSLFVAGTDTGVGKTWVSTVLIRAFVEAGLRVTGMKPVAAGAAQMPYGLRNDDAVALAAAGNVLFPYELTNPVCLPRATSPHLAAATAGKIVDIEKIKAAFVAISAKTDLIIVEGAGGWWAPIGDPPQTGLRGPTMADVAVALDLPVLLVVGLRLGCLNHALLTAHAIAGSGLTLIGWVANAVDPHFADKDDYILSLEQRLDAPRIEVGIG
jgi:dethiobiotin synthetase